MHTLVLVNTRRHAKFAFHSTFIINVHEQGMHPKYAALSTHMYKWYSNSPKYNIGTT